MPRTYEAATESVCERVMKAMAKYHPDLKDAELQVGVILAHAARDQNNEPSGPALTHGGYAAAATIRIVSLKDRAAGLPDVILTIDGDEMDAWSDERFSSLIDHEFCHPVLVTSPGGAIIRDDLGRPKLKMRKHDHQLGIFKEVIERHKEYAMDAEVLQAAWENCIQGVLNWG